MVSRVLSPDIDLQTSSSTSSKPLRSQSLTKPSFSHYSSTSLTAAAAYRSNAAIQRRLPAKPVLLSCQDAPLHVKFPHVIISNLLQGCFATSPKGTETRESPDRDDGAAAGAAAVAGSLVSLPSEALALLIVNYFASLPESDLVQREYVQAMIYSARHGEGAWAKQHVKQQHSMLLTHTQLPFLARLTAYASQGRVLVITAPSIGEGVEAALTKLDTVQHLPDYVIILQASKYWSIEVGVLVVNPVQSRALAEAIAQDAGVDPETVSQAPVRERQFVNLIAHGIGAIPGLNPGLDSFLKQFAANLASNPNGDAFSPFSEDELDLIQEEDVSRTLERIRPHAELFAHAAEATVTRASQEALAGRLMTRIRVLSDTWPRHLDLSRFRGGVELVVMVPMDHALFHQTVSRLRASYILVQLGLVSDAAANTYEAAARYVIKGRYHPEESAKFVKFVSRVRKNPTTLFLVVQDAAHLGLGKYEGEPANHVVVDTRLNCKDLLEADNVIALLVTSMPYALQHCSSRVSPDNEVHWDDEMDAVSGGGGGGGGGSGFSAASAVASAEKKKSVPSVAGAAAGAAAAAGASYIGLAECLGAMNNSRQPQFVRQDDEFEDAVYRQCSDVK